MRRTTAVAVLGVVAFLVFVTSGRDVVRAQQVAVWAPKPAQVPGWVAPQRPHVKLSDLKARHRNQQEWRELLVDDGHLQAEYISAAPGSTFSKRFHPDSRASWVVVDGQMRVEIEGQAPFVATKGSLVQVPKQTIYSMETIGGQPSLRFAVNISDAKTLFLQDAQPPALPGINWLRVTLDRRPAAYENGSQPHVNLFEAAKAPNYTGGPFLRDDKVSANIIYGYEKNLPTLEPRDKGHYHPNSPEFWLVMAGQIRYAFENHDVFIAEAGDVAYVPASRFHLARFYGDGPSCRLAIVRNLNNTPLVEP
jgi:quercetin dioxygenase-like cupin family protein